jgi:23S rRNA pseudouridine1911/1915/1917 synthase
MDWTVGPAEDGIRLDKFLAAADRLGSRRRASDALDRGKVFVNGAEARRADAARSLAPDDVIRVWVDRPGSARTRRPTRTGDVRILFEDDAIIVLEKPAGLLVVPLERRDEAPTVYDQLESHLRSRGKRRPLVVHRIDRDTSGLVVFAKTTLAQRRLRDQFRRHAAEREYLAVVYGHPTPPSGTWRDRLVWDQRALIQKETHPRDPRGKDAVSEYRIVERFDQASLVEVRLVTGKRNQIRIQARLRGHTLVGEARYVYGPDSLRSIPFERQALHARRLAFEHPIDGRRLEFEAAVPRDLTALIDHLRRRRKT